MIFLCSDLIDIEFDIMVILVCLTIMFRATGLETFDGITFLICSALVLLYHFYFCEAYLLSKVLVSLVDTYLTPAALGLCPRRTM